MSDEKTDTGKMLTAFLLTFLIAPILSIATVYAAEAFWDWYMFRQFGPGPSRAVWFGIFSLLSLNTLPIVMVSSRGDDKELQEKPVQTVVARSVLHLAMIGCVVISVMFAGVVMGWK